ncbi:MAG: TIR domain-containing protein [Cyanobacteriota bacterium]|nr:TIR domain-containing protein [Cyanobacteriota bacterium]
MSSDTSITKILILAVNPINSSRLRLDEEVREIEEGLRRSKQRDKFDIKSKWAVRPQDIRRAILDFDPQIVHFCGHGEADGGLVLEDLNGQMKLVQPEAIAGLFEQCIDTVECVLLNACYSYKQADAIVEHINYVIGMKQSIGDTAAIKFAMGFYDALGAGRNVEVAYKFGVNAIQLEGISEELTPILKKKPELNTNISNSSVGIDSNSAIEVFFSYASEDEKLRNQLEKHLSILKRQGVITGWHHRKIAAGKEWENDINIHLNTARVILLLISSDFIASNYCWDVELERAMKRHDRLEARVIPVILKPVDNWQTTSFGKLQPLPKNGKPVIKWGNRDEAFASIAQGIREAIEDLT